MPGVTTRDGPALGWLFLVFACLYLLTSGGHFYASDDLQKLGALDALVRTGRPAFAGGWTTGLGGLSYSWFTLGASLLMLPGYLVGRAGMMFVPWLPDTFALRFCITLENALVTAALVTLLAAFLRRLGYPLRACVFAACAFGLGTMAWPYAKMAWSEPGATLGLFAGCLALYVASTNRLAPGWLLGAGVAIAAAISIRHELVLVVPGALAWLVWRHRGEWGALLRALAILAVPLALMAVPELWYNLARFGEPTGLAGFHAVQAQVVMPGGSHLLWALENMWHYTLNPSDGLAWYAPALWLGLAGLPRFVRAQPSLSVLLALALGPLFAFLTCVWGLSDWAWGLRYAYTFQPFLCLPVAALAPKQPAARVACGLVLAVGVLVQVIAVVNNFNFVLERERASYPGLSVQQIMASPAHSPLWRAFEATPATLAGGVAELTAPVAAAAPVERIRLRAQYVPDVWPCLQWLTPMSRRAIAAVVALLLLGLLVSGWQLKRALTPG